MRQEIYRKLICQVPPLLKNNVMKLFYHLPLWLKIKFQRGLISIDLEITNACNANCLMCPRHKIKQIGFIKEKLFKKIVLKITKEKMKTVFFSGLGEPLLHPKLVKFIDFSIKNDIYPILFTNGFLLNKNMQDKLIKKGLKDFRISIPSINKDVFEKINREISFATVIKNLKDLIKHKNIDITINIVVSKLNEDYIEQIIDFCRKNNIKWDFFSITNRGIPDFNKNLTSYNSYETQNFIKIENICPISSTITFIGYDGGVYLCCNDIKREHKICDYLNYPLLKILELKKKYFRLPIELCNISIC